MKKTIKWIIVLIALTGAGWATALIVSNRSSSVKKVETIKPFLGNIKEIISTTGTVEPQNRLELKPPVAGRIEEIKVKEGDHVNVGSVLALISSTERAALLDAALLKNDSEVEYWQHVYKATPLIAPISGEVIARSVEPGQTVTTVDAVLVLSDRLIVHADVDETDIGNVNVGQKAVIGLDAYPDIRVNAVVNHISYESNLINNVTTYEVDILPEVVPKVFRSGMSANVEIIIKEKKDAMLLPVDTVKNEKSRNIVSVFDTSTDGFTSRPVIIGLQDEKHVEIVSGLTFDEAVVIPDFIPPKRTMGGNPFMPFGKKRNRKR